MWGLTILGVLGMSAAQYAPSGNPINDMKVPSFPALTFAASMAGTVYSANHVPAHSQEGQQPFSSLHYGGVSPNRPSISGDKCNGQPSCSPTASAEPDPLYGPPQQTHLIPPLISETRPPVPSPTISAPAASYGPPSLQTTANVPPPNVTPPTPAVSYGPPRPQSSKIPSAPVQNYGPPLSPPSKPAVVYGPPSRPERPTTLSPSTSAVTYAPPRPVETAHSERPSKPVQTYGPPLVQVQTPSVISKPTVSYGPPIRSPQLPSHSFHPTHSTPTSSFAQSSIISPSTNLTPQIGSQQPIHKYGPPSQAEAPVPPSSPALSYGAPSGPPPAPSSTYSPPHTLAPIFQHSTRPVHPHTQVGSPHRPAVKYGPP